MLEILAIKRSNERYQRLMAEMQVLMMNGDDVIQPLNCKIRHVLEKNGLLRAESEETFRNQLRASLPPEEWGRIDERLLEVDECPFEDFDILKRYM